MIGTDIIQSVSQMSQGLNGAIGQMKIAGMDAGGIADDMTKIALFIQMGMAGLEIMTATRVLYEQYKVWSLAQSAILVAGHSATGPLGWGKIALATGVAVGVSAFLIGLSASTGTPQGRLEASTGVSVIR